MFQVCQRIVAVARARHHQRLRKALHIQIERQFGLQRDRAALQPHPAARIGPACLAEDAAQRVQRVVQPVRRGLHAGLRPQRFGCFVARDAMARRQAQHLPQQPRVLVFPARRVDRNTVHADTEVTQHQTRDLVALPGGRRWRVVLRLSKGGRAHENSQCVE